LHTVAVAEVIQKATEIMETLEAWEQATEIKTAEDQAEAEDLTTDNLTVLAAEAAEHKTQG
jgi:hypothetical protein